GGAVVVCDVRAAGSPLPQAVRTAITATARAPALADVDDRTGPLPSQDVQQRLARQRHTARGRFAGGDVQEDRAALARRAGFVVADHLGVVVRARVQQVLRALPAALYRLALVRVVQRRTRV